MLPRPAPEVTGPVRSHCYVRSMSSFRLSVLDQSPVPEGLTGADALQNTLDLARMTEALGYHRYWVAEHHGGASLAGASPEVLIAAIGAATSTMRVGSGGVMLPHYSPLKVAETFSILSGLYGDRIDLGLGRAAGTDPMTTHALQRDRRTAPPDDFPEQLAELLAYLEDRFPPDHPFARLAQLPGGPVRPDPWLLGSSPQSALWAAELGLPYAFADFINPDGTGIADSYLRGFMDSGRRVSPELAVAAWVIAADTDEEARLLATSSRMTFKLLRRGRLIPVPPVDKAVRFLASEGDTVDAPPSGRRAIVGSQATVKAGLEELVAQYGAGEAIVVTITHDHAARRRSYELIAEAFGLDAPAGVTGARAGAAAA
jgi:luciferase family oxidoreductase group 1